MLRLAEPSPPRSIAALSLLCSWLAACAFLGCSGAGSAVGSDASTDAASADVSADDGDVGFVVTNPDTGPPPDPNSFDGVWTNTLGARCSIPECHANGAGGMTMTTVDNAYAALVGVPSNGCGSLLRVAAGMPDSSALVWKLGAHFADKCDPTGVQMPKSAAPIPAAELTAIRTWITNGAKR
jgi:hypothetical protein